MTLPDPFSPAWSYDTLSAQDGSFLSIEGPSHHMHIGATMVFDVGPLSRDGGVDFTAIRDHVAKRLHLIPRYRQRLARGLAGEALWIDDARFDLDWHVRHVRLTAPGTEDALQALSARIMSQPLDRGRPLWELWIVEGLQNDRFALINKTHHCLVDGLSGVEIIGALLSLTTEGTSSEIARSWQPHRPPSVLRLLRDRAGKPYAAFQELSRQLSAVVRDPRAAWNSTVRSVRAVGEALSGGLGLAAATRFNHPISARRLVEWLVLDLAEVKEVKNRLGGTLNDTILATVAGALRRFLRDEHATDELRDLRALVPVSVRADGERSALGNRISAWVVEMPIADPDPRRRLARIARQTMRAREGDSAHGLEIMWSIGYRAFAFAPNLMQWASPFNLIVTNVPGPPVPLYLLGARLTDLHPHVPLFTNQGLGVALVSYAGRLCWGFNADQMLVPDLAEFRRCVAASFDELRELAREGADRGRTSVVVDP